MSIFLNATADINTALGLARSEKNLVNPEVFYSKQLLDTIRIDGSQFVYYRYAEEQPIENKADKLVMRRWAPLRAHTIPLQEGIPPTSDKGSVEKFEITANKYGRYMEFTEEVDYKVVDPVIAHYTAEYALVAVETLDLLARETLFSVASPYYANGVVGMTALTVASTPNLVDLRLITLAMKKNLVKPRSNGKYHVIASPEFFFDMISDETVEKFMTINQSTKSMYENGQLVPLFGMEFYETLEVPTSPDYVSNGEPCRLVYRVNGNGYEYGVMTDSFLTTSTTGEYDVDSRTGQSASFIPYRSGYEKKTWDLDAYNATNPGGHNDWEYFNVQHILVLGKDALKRTGLTGEGAVKTYVKPVGSTGVLDPINQRQSIGFKINSVGFGCQRLDAVVDYICVPTQIQTV